MLRTTKDHTLMKKWPIEVTVEVGGIGHFFIDFSSKSQIGPFEKEKLYGAFRQLLTCDIQHIRACDLSLSQQLWAILETPS